MPDIIPELQKLRHKVTRLSAAAEASHHPEIKLAFESARQRLQERADALEAALASDQAPAA